MNFFRPNRGSKKSPRRARFNFESLESRSLLTVALTSVPSQINLANAANTSVSGTGDVGASISVVADDGTLVTPVVTTTVAADGTWTISGINVTGLHDGAITYRAADTTHGPPVATLTTSKDTTPPVVFIVSLNNPAATGKPGSATVTGVGEVGTTISVVASDGTHTTSPRTAVVAANGTWSIDGINLSTLNDGPITITASGADAAGNPNQSTRTTSKITADGELSGFVYVDANRNNRKNSGEHVLGGVTISLTGHDAAGNPLPSQTTVTASDGSYHFTGLLPGIYTIREAQPTNIASYKAAAGNLGGKAGANVIANIEVGPHEAGAKYNFAEKGLTKSAAVLNPFLASSDPSQQQLNKAVAAGSTTAPIVKSISKRNADPTDADSVSYAVKFNKPVKGVDANDFLLLVNGVSAAAITKITGSGSKYTVTLSTGQHSGAVSLYLIDNGTIVDKSGNALGGAGFRNGDFAAEAYSIEKAPVVAVTSLTTPIDATNKTNTAISGTGEAGSVISIVASDGTHSTAAVFTTVSSSGTWSLSGIDVSTLDDGTITYTATDINNAGKLAQATRTTTKATA